jgi:hypothetical protein
MDVTPATGEAKRGKLEGTAARFTVNFFLILFLLLSL